MEFVLSSGILIPREFEREDFYIDIKSHLTRVVRDYTGTQFTTLKFYQEGEKFLKIPRFFPIHNFIDCKIKDSNKDGEDIKIEHNITLRDEVQKNAVEYLINNPNGIIQASPGSGKTVITIFMISQLKKKSLILVHRGSLIDQWKERVLSYTNLNEYDISKLNSETYKEDLKKSIILVTDQTFTSLLKRNRIEFLKELNCANIGIFIADEAHTSSGAPTFAECSLHIPCKYAYGLSATPYRNDKNTDIIKYHLGEVFTPIGKASTMKVKVTIMCYSYGIMTSKSKHYVMWGGELNRARYLNMISKSPVVEKVSLSLIKKFINDSRNILFMAERIKFLEKMYSLSPTENKSKFMGKAGNSELNSKLVFATIGKCKEGVDAQHLDCLIITSPVSNIEQLAGRITRIKENKRTPIIVDMVDIDDPAVYRSIFNRIKYYKKENWDIQYLIMEKDQKFYVIEEQEFYKKLK